MIELEIKVANVEAQLKTMDRKYKGSKKERNALKTMLQSYKDSLKRESQSRSKGPGSSYRTKGKSRNDKNETDRSEDTHIFVTSEDDY